MKLNKHAWVVWGITLIVSIALMILIPFTRTVSWWIAACCTVLMFGLCALTFVLAFRKDKKLASKVLGWPIFKAGYTALFIQLAAGTILMGIAYFCPAWIAVIVELIIFACTGVCLTVEDAAREVVQQSELTIADNTGAWKAIRNRANALAISSDNPEMTRLTEAIRFADPTPTSLDGQISELLETISSHPDEANIRRAFQLMNQRKTLAKEEK